MIRFLVIIIASVCLIIPVKADNVSLYGSLDDSNNIANLLGDVMRNDPAYDPYNEYVIVRSGEREYRLYFGEDLSKSSVKYTYIPSYMANPASLSRSNVNNSLDIISNGYTYVGNINGSLASSSVDNYKTNYVLSVCAILIVIFVIFKIFRRERSSGDRYYRVR